MYYLWSAVIGIVCGIIGAVLWDYIRVCSKRHNKKKQKSVEFSKLLLMGVMTTYFIGVIVGIWAVIAVSVEQLGVLLTYIGSPVVIAIGFYSWKSKAENMIKLKKEHPDETGDMCVDLNNIQS